MRPSYPLDLEFPADAIGRRIDFRAAGQAQKEVTHNQAVQAIDHLLHPSVKLRTASEPPQAATLGDSWIVGEQAVGSWTGMAGSIAVFEGFGWAFVKPRHGMLAWIEDEGSMAVWRGSWSLGWPVTSFSTATTASIEVPVSGANVDAELRSSFAALVFRLRALGLVA